MFRRNGLNFLKLSLILNCFRTDWTVHCTEIPFACNDCEGLLVDTDLGADDAMAISMIIQKQKLEGPGLWGPLLALTTTTGLTGANNATRNAHFILDTLKINVPVVEGGLDALDGPVESARFFGNDGFGDFLPPIKTNQEEHFIKTGMFLAETVRKNPGKMTLLCLGPLTNLALALHINTKFMEQIRHIFILGGDYQGTGELPDHPGIEVNMYNDPGAAAYFFNKFSSLDKVTMVPNEAVLTLAYPKSFRTERLGKIKGKLMDVLNKAERVSISLDKDLWYAYNPSAAAILLDPGVVATSTPAKVVVVTEGPKGAMFAQINSSYSNVNMVTTFNKDIFTSLLFKYLKS